MFAARRAAALAVKSAAGVQIISFEITIDAFTAGTCGPTTRGGLDHHQWRLILLRNLRRR
jgi:hypothetical protein